MNAVRRLARLRDRGAALNRDLKREQFIQFTPSGVVRLNKLQLQGHAYIKP